jgi:hypothetical protein
MALCNIELDIPDIEVGRQDNGELINRLNILCYLDFVWRWP